MKRRLLVLSLITLATASTASFALADATQAGSLPGDSEVSTPSARQPVARCNHNRGKKAAAMAAVLGLTEAQQSQIKAIVNNARQTNAPLRQKLADDRDKIKELSSATPFDDAAVRTLLASDETVRTELSISRINVRKQIQAVLTPDQQTKSKQLRLLASNRHQNRGNGGF